MMLHELLVLVASVWRLREAMDEKFRKAADIDHECWIRRCEVHPKALNVTSTIRLIILSLHLSLLSICNVIHIMRL